MRSWGLIQSTSYISACEKSFLLLDKCCPVWQYCPPGAPKSGHLYIWAIICWVFFAPYGASLIHLVSVFSWPAQCLEYCHWLCQETCLHERFLIGFQPSTARHGVSQMPLFISQASGPKTALNEKSSQSVQVWVAQQLNLARWKKEVRWDLAKCSQPGLLERLKPVRTNRPTNTCKHGI